MSESHTPHTQHHRTCKLGGPALLRAAAEARTRDRRKHSRVLAGASAPTTCLSGLIQIVAGRAVTDPSVPWNGYFLNAKMADLNFFFPFITPK